MTPYQKRNIRRCLVYVVLILLVAALFILGYQGFAMVDYAMRPKEYRQRTVAHRYENLREEHPVVRPWLDSVQRAKALRDTTIRLADGNRSHALYLRNPRATGQVAVIVHGYTDSAIGILQIGMLYERMGYNILLPDLPAHGESDGEFIGMGWPDRLVVERWIAVADSMFSRQRPRIVVHGISMGAATTMNVSGDNPSQVNCYVEDCGYTSAWDEFAHELKEQFGLPPFPVLYAASLANKVRQGWTFGECSPLKQVAKCRRPMLFIHGDNDTYVPSAMVHPLYEAKTGVKELWIGRGSKHARSFDDHPGEYTKVVHSFVEKYNK